MCRLLELDGRKAFAVDHGPTTQEDLLKVRPSFVPLLEELSLIVTGHHLFARHEHDAVHPPGEGLSRLPIHLWSQRRCRHY